MDSTFQASRIASDWPLICGGKLTPALDGVIAAWVAADAARPPAPAIEVGDIDAGNAAEAVLSAADAEIRSEYFNKAKRRIVDDLGRRVVAQAGAAAPELLGRPALAGELRTAAAEFAEAVAQLPDRWEDPATLVASGPAAVDNFHRAVKAQGTLKKLDHFVASIPGANLPGRENLHVLRLLRPVDRAQYQGLLTAAGRHTKSQLSQVFIYAVEHDIAWQLNDPAAQRAIADEINAQPVAKRGGWR
jgi:hypothetical protein